MTAEISWSTKGARPKSVDRDPTVEALGPIVLNCRTRSMKERELAVTRNRFAVFVVPFLAAIFPMAGAGLLYCTLYELLSRPPQLKNPVYVQLTMFIAYLASCPVAWWVYRRQPSTVWLALHRDGIRFGGQTYRFDDLFAIRDGREPKGVDRVGRAYLRMSSWVVPSARITVEAIDASNAASLTLVLKNGRTPSLKGVGIWCHPDDFDRFLELVRRENPRLFS